ncbi:M23 family metallopeptidase [Candidatus Woesebacteria bacterium]|nr:M23 family metallopeptidase [Candidatus Woesebacteria bacterium]
MKDLREFLLFLKSYAASRLLYYGSQIEKLKDVIVALLVVKRGKYSSSFLNTSFLFLIVIVLVAGPAIAENNPFHNDIAGEQAYFQTNTIGFDPFENPVTTLVSAKPRDRVYAHSVVSGDTLASLASRYQVSVDTIKWANSLKSDIIKPGQSLDIPPVTGIVHKVVGGDNIYTIAKKYNVDAQNIVNFPFNDFADPDTFQLTPGQALYIPDGTIVEKVAPKQTQFRYVAKAQAGVQGTSSFIWPTTGSITTYPVWYHMALDIANRASPPILASDTGTVTYTGCLTYGYGCHIIIDHGNGFQSLYGHLSSIEANAGQVVSKGQRIGAMGSTGRSTGTHLHFEIRSGGAQQNPLGYLQ